LWCCNSNSDPRSDAGCSDRHRRHKRCRIEFFSELERRIRSVGISPRRFNQHELQHVCDWLQQSGRCKRDDLQRDESIRFDTVFLQSSGVHCYPDKREFKHDQSYDSSAYSHPDSDGDSHAYSDTHTHTHTHTNSYAYSHTDTDTNSHANPNSNPNSYSNTYSNSDGDSNACSTRTNSSTTQTCQTILNL
jgi:hypothetical protein